MSSVITALDVSTVVDRTIAWALARSKPDEEGNINVPNKETEIVKNKIDERRKNQDEGEFVPSRLDDVLNRPLKKRDLGSGVAIKEAFGKGESKGIGEATTVEIERRVMQKLREEKEELREELKKELRAEMTSRMNVLFQEKLGKQAGLPNQMEVETNSMIPPHVPGSCKSRVANSLATLEEIPKEQSPKRNEVVSGAKSKKFGSGHNRKGFLKTCLIPTMR